MKLYPIPGGGWAGTEADWKKQMKARGLNPKDFEATKTREVPTGKADLMEFLTFFAVDVYRTGSDTVVTGGAPVDLAALQALHNPTAADATGARTAAQMAEAVIEAHDMVYDLTAAFEAAPVKLQAQLCVAFIDRLA